MRRFRLWLARKLIGHESFIANTTFTNCTSTGPTRTSSTSAVLYPTADGSLYRYTDAAFTKLEPVEDEMGKKKKRTKAAGKAAAKSKQENKAKARGGKGAR